MNEVDIILGIDPGLAHTGWGVIEGSFMRYHCLAYGCIATLSHVPLEKRLEKIYDQVKIVIDRYRPTMLGIETVWFGENVTAAFATGQARGVLMLAASQADLYVGEYSPKQIKLAVVGEGSADKTQVQYMVKQFLDLDDIPRPDHAADALAAAICHATHSNGLLATL